ncbi:hypothetical protein MMC17_007706 [Xylographa soralifera]|nr:hypothetical protein [Xylographa soralifera]
MATPNMAAFPVYSMSQSMDDRAPALYAACSLSIIFVVIPLILRFYAQHKIGKAFAIDMWLISFAAILALAITGCTIVATQYGLGKHQLGYVITVLQGVCLAAIKLSILTFYQRVFTLRNRSFKIAVRVVAIYSILLCIGATLEFLLACIPIPLFWERVYLIVGGVPPHALQGSCLPQTVRLSVPFAADLVSEIAILILPAIVLWKLHLPTKKKLALFVAFSFGIFVTAMSVIRMYYAFQLTNDDDITWDDTDSYIWTALQASFGVTSACILAMAPLYRIAQAKASSGQSGSGRGLGRNLRNKFLPLKETPSNNTVAKESKALSGPAISEQDRIQGRDYEDAYYSEAVGGAYEDLLYPLQNVAVQTEISVSVGNR